MRDTVYVIGGGPSIQLADLRQFEYEDTICINKSAFFVPNPTYMITMDYTLLKKISLPQMKALTCTRFFVVNLSVPYLTALRGAIVDTRSRMVYEDIYEFFDTVILCRSEHGIGMSFHDFRCGNNSGYCGLQLAVVLGYTNIYLVGIDLKVHEGHTHFHAGYREGYSQFGKRVTEYGKAFQQGLRDIRTRHSHINVYSCSSISSLNEVIPYVSLTQLFPKGES